MHSCMEERVELLSKHSLPFRHISLSPAPTGLHNSRCITNTSRLASRRIPQRSRLNDWRCDVSKSIVIGRTCMSAENLLRSYHQTAERFSKTSSDPCTGKLNASNTKPTIFEGEVGYSGISLLHQDLELQSWMSTSSIKQSAFDSEGSYESHCSARISK